MFSCRIICRINLHVTCISSNYYVIVLKWDVLIGRARRLRKLDIIIGVSQTRPFTTIGVPQTRGWIYWYVPDRSYNSSLLTVCISTLTKEASHKPLVCKHINLQALLCNTAGYFHAL